MHTQCLYFDIVLVRRCFFLSFECNGRLAIQIVGVVGTLGAQQPKKCTISSLRCQIDPTKGFLSWFELMVGEKLFVPPPPHLNTTSHLCLSMQCNKPCILYVGVWVSGPQPPYGPVRNYYAPRREEYSTKCCMEGKEHKGGSIICNLTNIQVQLHILPLHFLFSTTGKTMGIQHIWLFKKNLQMKSLHSS